ncbi:MAG: hypothetical protein ACOCM8_06050 [Acetivibrio ethanolgignens]
MNSKKMTFDDIIRAKLQKENDRLTVKPVRIPSVGKDLIFRRPKDEEIFDFIDNISENQKTTNMKVQFQRIIYLCCDDLQNTELHKELGVTDPFDTVEAFMDANDIMTVGDEVCSMNSMYKNFGDEVKN